MNGVNQGTDYPVLREALAPQFAALSDEQIDMLVEQYYGPGVNAEDLEGLFDDIGRGLSNVAGAVGNFAQKAAPMVQRALPGIAQGAMAGSALGPWGALAGAIAGGAGSMLSQSRDPTLSSIGRGLGGVTQLASTMRGGGAAGGIGQLLQGGLAQLGGRGGPGGALGTVASLAQGALSQLGGAGGAKPPAGASANALLGLLARPEVGQALMSAAMGGLGRQNVQIGPAQVGVQSILSALGNLAGRAAGEMESANGAGLPGYFYDANGELAIDPADSHQRTDALLTYMALTAPVWAAPRPPVVVVRDHDREPEYTEAHAAADALLWAEMFEADEQEAYA